MVFYDRDKLYEEVWREPVTAVAKRYGVSDVAIRKACRRLNVPTPGLGYWQKHRVGAKIDRPPLPASKGEFAMRANRGCREQADSARGEPEKAKAGKFASPEKIVVPDQLRNPHTLVVQTLERLKSCWKARCEKDPVIRVCGHVLDMRVAKSSAERALRIMDALLNALAVQGISVACGGRQREETYAAIEGQAIGFRMQEELERVQHEKTAEEIKRERRHDLFLSPTYDYLPTGVLVLTIEYHRHIRQKNWRDTSKHRLEDCLGDFVAALKDAAADSKAEAEKRREQERLWKEEQDRRRALQELREAELEKVKALERDAADWKRAQAIKGYIDALEAALGGSLPPEELERGRAYIGWARDKIDWLDPLVRRRDELLGCRKGNE